MLELEGEFGRVRLGGGPRGNGVYWVDDAGRWNKFDPLVPESIDNQNFDTPLRNRKIAYGLLGMVRLEINTEAKTVEIRWNVRAANSYSIDVVCNYLNDLCLSYKIRLCFYIDAWNYEKHSRMRDAISRVQDIKNFRQINLIDSFFLKSLGFDQQVKRTKLIADCISTYEITGGHLGHPEFRRLMPYLLVYKPYEVENQMIIASAGFRSANAKVYGSSWAKKANGSKYDNETPGTYYSQRASEAYTDVIERDEPRLDQIRAIMERPNDEPIWSSYQRFLFRGRLQDGTPVLACMSDLNKGMVIPFLVS